MGFHELKPQIQQAPDSPGVYRMLDNKGAVIYVGKARNLKKRLKSYLSSGLDNKTQALLTRVVTLETTLTSSESEALLLEAETIKRLKPRYNILLKDDKSYPYLYFSTNHDYPRVDFIRGEKKKDGRYFGPYPSAGSVRENITLVQKLFKIRTCRDSYFNSRTRPCLQYQIGRCTAPCVQRVSQDDYKGQVSRALLFLEGKNEAVIESIQADMQQASAAREYEKASQLRDQIAHLRMLQRSPSDEADHQDMDIIAVTQKDGRAVVAVLVLRGGRLMGGRTYRPKLAARAVNDDEVMSAFVMQYYLNEVRGSDLPSRVLLSMSLGDRQCIEQALRHRWSCKVRVVDRNLGRDNSWVQLAMDNATANLKQWVASGDQVRAELSSLSELLGLSESPECIDCFDVSHTQGEATVASCVVFRGLQMERKLYRRFNISQAVQAGDDYAAMREALQRRYKKLAESDHELPDIVLIDGGAGQLRQAAAVVDDLSLSGITLLGISKGPERNAGQERYWVWVDGSAEVLPVALGNPARRLLQQIRDEAHRFAITGHRKQRDKSRVRSTLEDIPGVGKKRRQVLLQHFGGMAELRKASAEEIASVPGIGAALAVIIFNALHA